MHKNLSRKHNSISKSLIFYLQNHEYRHDKGENIAQKKDINNWSKFTNFPYISICILCE